MRSIAEPHNLLIVDDEPAIRSLILNSLRDKGFALREAGSGEEALLALAETPADLVLLDVSMPGLGGIQTCRKIRSIMPSVGIVAVGASEREADQVLAFEAGADDYVTRPFRFRELLARIRSILRRVPPGYAEPPALIQVGELELNPGIRVLRKAGVEIRLSRKEYDVLEFLMRHKDMPVPHEKLLRAVWGAEHGSETEYLRSYIKSLRKKIEENPAMPQYIQTEPWLGYRFRDPARAETPTAAAWLFH